MKFNFENTYKFPNSMEEIDNFSGKEFEMFLFHFFKLCDYNETTLTDDSGDRGIDITIKTKEKEMIGIQAKRWKSSVNSEQVTKMLEGKIHYHLESLWIITTSGLTAQAVTTALNNNIRIITRSDIEDMLNDIKTMPNAVFREKQTFNISRNTIIKEKLTTLQNTETLNTIPNKELFEKLKELRKSFAKEEKMYPIYTVFTDATIMDLIDKMPKSIDDLYDIKGLGEKRISKYGEKLLSILSDYQ